MSSRATAPVIGVVILIGLTVALGAGVAVLVGGISSNEAPVDVRMTGTFDPETNEISLRHRGGEVLPVADTDLHVRIDDEPLAHQPPIPFFAAKGFSGGPTGPFNPASDATWAAGEVGTLRIAGTNDPVPTTDSTVEVRVVLREQVVATVDLTPA